MTVEMAKHQQANVVRGGAPADELNLLDCLRVLFKYRWWLLLACFLASGVVGVISYLGPDSYLAVTSVAPPIESPQGDSGLGMSLLGGGVGALLRDAMNVTSVADMYVGILESRVVTDAIIDRFDLTAVYRVEPARYKARKKLRAYTTIKVSDDGILYITVEDKDRKRAAAIANAYVEELDRQNKRLSAGHTASKRAFLETRLQDMERKLSQSENIPSHELQIQEMLYELLMRELEIAKIEEAKSMPTIQVLDEAVPPERRKAKGTVRRVGLAWITVFVAMAFFVFAREYLAGCRAQETTARLPSLAPGAADLLVRRDDGDQNRVAPVTEVEVHSARKAPEHVELSREM
ncbi:MAG: hypothetical protein JSW27_00670 [Phycisphaerales bacterium]|nr:MAG: hypothetical protein JSW27_00670 [Phycisphaerales bacterium]